MSAGTAPAVATAQRSSAALSAVAALVPVVPLGVLAWQVGGVLAHTVEPACSPAVLALTAAGVAAWGGHSGLAAGGRDRPARQGRLARLGRLALVVLVAVGLRLLSPTSTTAMGGLHGGPAGIVDPLLIALTVVLVLVAAAARAVGRSYRRQADPRGRGARQQRADLALPAMMLTGLSLAVLLHTVGWLTGVPGLPVAIAGWVPPLYLTASLTGIALGRDAVLRARSSTPGGPGGRAWWRAVIPLAAAAALLLLVIAGVGLHWGGEAWLMGLTRQLRGGGMPAGLRPPLVIPGGGGHGRPYTPIPSHTAPWQLVAMAGIFVLLGVLVAATGRARRRDGPGLPLWVVLRGLFGIRGSSRRARTMDEESIAPALRPQDAERLPGAVRGLFARLRPRPRDPAAAILYDYGMVQRRLAGRGRRASETALRHAARIDDARLGELAQLVCAVRYAGHVPSAADAQRSRELARRLVSG